MKKLAVLVAALAAALPAGDAAAALVVRGDNFIGDYHVKKNWTLEGAIDAFGAPTRVVQKYQDICTVSWRHLGLRMRFYNLGGQDACAPRYGYFSHAVIKGDDWRTARGLAIGYPVSKLRELYPKARYHSDRYYGRGYWLVTRDTPFGVGGTYPGLMARTCDGRVVGFVVRFPAGGD